MMDVDYSHFHSVTNNFCEQLRNEEFLDCTLNAEGKSIKVHKAVLCAQSSLLEKMILEHVHVGDLFFTLDGVLFEDLKSVVQFMYDGCAKLTRENFSTFLVAAKLLGMKWVDYIQIHADGDRLPPFRSEAEMINVDLRTKECRVQPLILRNITNLPTKTKRKKCLKAKKHSRKLKSARLEKKILAQERPAAKPDVEETEMLPETDLAKMDENTFYAALGLKKVVDVREPSTKLKEEYRVKNVTSVAKINLAAKEIPENIARCDVDGPVYIAEKNLILNAGANEMCIRENDIEIECDVLDATNQLVVYGKENAVGELIEIRDDCSMSSGTVVKKGRKNYAHVSKRVSVKKEADKPFEGPTVFWCDVCQRTYHTKTGLNQHKRYECCKEPAFACPRCEKRFKRKSSLVRHAITLHDETIYPTRTKLLSKLTSLANRNILTICGKRTSQ